MAANDESGREEAGQEEAILKRIVQENDETSDVYELVSQFRGRLPIRNYGHIRSAVARGIRLRGQVYGHHHFENEIPGSFYPIEDEDTLVERATEVMRYAYQKGYPRQREVAPGDVEGARRVLRQAGVLPDFEDAGLASMAPGQVVEWAEPLTELPEGVPPPPQPSLEELEIMARPEAGFGGFGVRLEPE